MGPKKEVPAKLEVRAGKEAEGSEVRKKYFEWLEGVVLERRQALEGWIGRGKEREGRELEGNGGKFFEAAEGRIVGVFGR